MTSRLRNHLGLATLLKFAIPLLVFSCASCARKTNIDWGTQLQTIDGFGASIADSIGPLTSSLATFFFSQSSGIGLSIIRTQVVPDLADCNAWALLFNPPPPDPARICAPVGSGATSLVGEIAIAQQAAPYGVTLIASCWSPPASLKANGLFYRGGPFISNPTNYASFASILASYVSLMASYGITISAISPQNEPDVSTAYPSAVWTAREFHDFVPYLYAVLPSSVKIIIGEQGGWEFNLSGEAFNDPTVAGEVGIIGGHAYHGNPRSTGLRNVTHQHIWMTEASSQSATYDGGMTDALAYARRIYDYLTQAKINAWVHWFLSNMPMQGYGTDNSALTDINGNIPLRAYALGNWSKFVRPGWHMVGVPYSGGPLITAFQDASGISSAIVVVNDSMFSVQETFAVGSAMGGMTTPWITSSTLRLAAQAPVTISSGSFTYAIPARSVTTFSSHSVSK